MKYFKSMSAFCVLFALLVANGCSAIIADYNLEAYKYATTIKAKSLKLVDESSDPYAKHKTAAEQLLLEIDEAYEFAAGLPANQIAAEQWKLVRDPNRNFIAGYIKQWRERKTGVPEFFRKEAKRGISSSFDYIICLEANKEKASSCTSLAPAQ